MTSWCVSWFAFVALSRGAAVHAPGKAGHRCRAPGGLDRAMPFSPIAIDNTAPRLDWLMFYLGHPGREWMRRSLPAGRARCHVVTGLPATFRPR